MPNETVGNAVMNAGKQKKKRPIIPIVIAVIVVIVVIGAFGASNGDKPSSVSGNASASASTSQQQADYSNMHVGETVTLNNGLAITVNDFEVYVPEFSDSPVTRVNVTYANNGDEKQSFNIFDWKAEDANGAERSITFALDSKDELNSGDLREGGSVVGNIYFEGDNNVKVYYYSNALFQSDSEIAWNLA